MIRGISSFQVFVVMGLQWGDEGKGKIVDALAEKFDIVARASGGANAGHTIFRDKKKHVFHLIPSGVLEGSVSCVIANGTVVDVDVFFEELDDLTKAGVNFDNRIFISRRAHVIFPYHILADKYSEQFLGDEKIGTTCRGIAPAYRDKIARKGIRFGDFEDLEIFEKKFKINAEFWMKNHDFEFDINTELLRYKKYAEKIKPFLIDSEDYFWKNYKNGKKILIEGAQGTLLDIDFGTYPFVTSSNTTLAGFASGTGISPRKFNHILGIVKAYTTRVGEGIFPSELKDETGNFLQKKGAEYGATTGRPRRCGWLDFPLLRRSINLCDVDSINLTKLDVLSGLKKIKVLTNYKFKSELLDLFPSNEKIIKDCEFCFEELDGWDEDISDVRRFEDLPKNARNYVKFIENNLDVKVSCIGIGQDKNDLIYL